MSESSSAFLFPYTSINPYDIDAAVASSFLYDEVYYLDYWEDQKKDPLYEGLIHWDSEEGEEVTKEIRTSSKMLLRSLTSKGILRSLSYRKFNPFPLSCEIEQQDRIIINNYQDIIDTLKNTGLAARAKREGKGRIRIATVKFVNGLLSILPITRDQIPMIDEVPLDWNDGMPLLIMYANWASAIENHSPFAFDRLHADALNAVMKKRSMAESYATLISSQMDSKLKNLFYGKFIELAIPKLRNCYEYGRNPQKLLAIRENTRELRKDFLEGLSHVYDEYIADLDPSKYGQELVITEDILPKIKDYREELQRNSSDNSFVSTIKGEVSGFFGEVSALGMAHLCLPSVLDPLGLSIAIGIAAAEKAAKITYEYRKKSSFTVQKPLSSIVFYMNELENI